MNVLSVSFIFGIVALLAYVLVSICVVYSWNHPPDLARLLTMLGCAFHAVYLWPEVVHENTLDLSFFHSIALIAWGLSICCCFFVRTSYTLLLLIPFCSLLLLCDVLFGASDMARESAPINVELHILCSLAAGLLLLLAAIQAGILALQHNGLRAHRLPIWLQYLPPLLVMERILFRLVEIGFAFLCFSLLTGFLFVDEIFARQMVHKTLLSLFAWGGFGSLLLARRKYGWRGITAVYITLAAFITLLLASISTRISS